MNLVCVIVYQREENIKIWLKCWAKSDTAGSKLAIIHNQDDLSIESPLKQLCKEAGVIYQPRQNVGMDIGALKEVCQEKLFSNILWDNLLWFTDDTLPIRPSFIREFTFAAKGGASCYYISDSPIPHIRTVGFCLRKEVVSKLKFQENIITKEDCYYFEFKGGDNNLYYQLLSMGITPKQLSLDPMYNSVWDSNHNDYMNRWEEQKLNFDFEEVSQHVKSPLVQKSYTFVNHKSIHKPNRHIIKFK